MRGESEFHDERVELMAVFGGAQPVTRAPDHPDLELLWGKIAEV
jgi:hypothetical protein